MKLTSNPGGAGAADSYLYGYLTNVYFTLSANTLYRAQADVYVPAGQTLDDAHITKGSLGDAIVAGISNTTLVDATWTTIYEYIYIVSDVTGGFRVWRRETLQGMPLDLVRSDGYVFQVEMAYIATRLGYKLIESPIYFEDRRIGQSKMSFRIQIEAALRVWQIKYLHRKLKSH